MVRPMELRQLRYFVAVAESGNISRAAQKIFLTQPALSRQIKALEEEIGQCLLERQAHSIRLTPAGEAMLHEARELLARVDGVVERVRTGAAGGRLRIGYAPSLASGLLSPAVANFTQVHPGTRVELQDLSTGEMLAGLEAGELDVIVTIAPRGETRGLTWTPLVRSPWRLAVGLKHPLARQNRVTPAAVAAEPLLIYSQSDYPEYWETVTAWLKEHGLRARVAGEYNGVDSLLAAVESGLGVALVAERIARLFPARTRMKVVSAPPGDLCIAAGCRTDRASDKRLAVFVEELRGAAAGMVDGG
ncbi:LysR family transcriptional regulator [Horticoccus luteus]|uniref:LysR family transcriptional regulator n=1 Tax=Horticoccus luteus TaxID=2862869 RepID=A0A8F9XGF1_9BACT|nr:LysR family transcriptional regulator [Horticoccus luteus]QYM79132.1 LysR family transcriptional regulator [Horticoccus luteus]